MQNSYREVLNYALCNECPYNILNILSYVLPISLSPSLLIHLYLTTKYTELQYIDMPQSYREQISIYAGVLLRWNSRCHLATLYSCKLWKEKRLHPILCYFPSVRLPYECFRKEVYVGIKSDNFVTWWKFPFFFSYFLKYAYQSNFFQLLPQYLLQLHIYNL